MPEPFAQHQYPTTAQAVALARGDCRAFLRSWGIPATNGFVGDMVLMASELMTNAITHGRVWRTSGRKVSMAITKTGNLFRLEVRDTQSDRMPVLREANGQELKGRGLFLVDSVSDKWGVREEVIGKTVWAEKEFDTGTDEK